MTDIVDRLRAETTEPTWQTNTVKVIAPTPLALEAAAEIERLRSENRTLRNVGISQMEQINRLLAQQTA